MSASIIAVRVGVVALDARAGLEWATPGASFVRPHPIDAESFRLRDDGSALLEQDGISSEVLGEQLRSREATRRNIGNRRCEVDSTCPRDDTVDSRRDNRRNPEFGHPGGELSSDVDAAERHWFEDNGISRAHLTDVVYTVLKQPFIERDIDARLLCAEIRVALECTCRKWLLEDGDIEISKCLKCTLGFVVAPGLVRIDAEGHLLADGGPCFPNTLEICLERAQSDFEFTTGEAAVAGTACRCAGCCRRAVANRRVHGYSADHRPVAEIAIQRRRLTGCLQIGEGERERVSRCNLLVDRLERRAWAAFLERWLDALECCLAVGFGLGPARQWGCLTVADGAVDINETDEKPLASVDWAGSRLEWLLECERKRLVVELECVVRTAVRVEVAV